MRIDGGLAKRFAWLVSDAVRLTTGEKFIRVRVAVLVAFILATGLSTLAAPASAATVTFPRLTQQGYVWENDDQTPGASADGDSAQAAGNTAISNVGGERLTLRTQLTNTGAALTSATDLSLFYDRNDGIWSKVRASASPVTSAGTCADTNFNCGAVDTTTAGGDTSMAVDQTGNPWIAYQETSAQSLRVAHYVGSGGNCGAGSAWTCTTLDSYALGGSGDRVGNHVAIGVAPDNTPWIAYHDNTAAGLMVAHYVGTGGTGCAVTSWSCGVMDWQSNMGNSPLSITFDSSSSPWISYWDAGNKDLWVSHYVGSSGTGCDATGGNGQWLNKFTCTKLDATGNVGQWSSIALDPAGNPWVSYYDFTNDRVKVARYVGSGGTGCASGTIWKCEAIDAGGEYTSIAFSPSGVAWVSYYDDTNGKLRYSTYSGGGSSTCSISANWDCAYADVNVGAGQYTSIAFDPAGNPWIAEYDATNANLKMARYVSSGGTGCGTGITAWTCTTVDNSSADVGDALSLAFGNDGTAWVSYDDVTNGAVWAASLNRGGEIVTTPGLAGNVNGASISKSHADMTTTSDTTNNSDADCLAASTTWNNGKWFTSENGNISISDGNTTSQCTEVAFMLSTAQAKYSTTYRFVVATDDTFAGGRSTWRGMSSVLNYPTLTTAGASIRAAKDVVNNGSQTCTDASWICANLDTSGDTGSSSSIAFDSGGTAWIAYADMANDALKWGKRIGSSGTGCNSSTWNCGTIDSGSGHDYSGNNLGPISMSIDPAGNPWIAYYDAGASYLDLRVARYVGTGGSGCAAGVTAWTCVSVDTGGDVGKFPSLQFDRAGTAWISYYDATNKYLRVAHYVGANGTGCATAVWACSSVVTANDAGSYSSMSIDPNGNPWIAYRLATTTRLAVARYVGTGGTGCAFDAWTCYAVDTTGNTGQYTSITFDGAGTAWVGYYDVTNQTQRMAHFIGSGGGSGSGCGSGSSTAWSCIVLDNSVANVGRFGAMATDSSGNPWLSYKDQTNDKRKIAHYVGSGGTGCASGVTSWTCGVLAGDTTYAGWTDIAFDAGGAPWTSYYMTSTFYLAIAKMTMSAAPPTSAPPAKSLPPGGHSARRADGRYMLDSGGVPRGTTCGAATNGRGYCGIASNDANVDGISPNIYERPTWTFAAPAATNTSFPSYKWVGQTSFSNTMNLQVYRFGSTNAWVTLTTQASPTTGTDYSLVGTASAGTPSEYWQTDGSRYWTYYRFYQLGSTGTPTSFTEKTNYFGGTLPPNSPASLAQVTTSDAVIATGDWSQSSVKFSASVSDQDPADTDALCVEIQPVSTAFTNTETQCGTGVAYSGTPLAASVTVSGLTSGTSYHWQARVKDINGLYSSWLSYGGNSDVITAATDVRIDTAAPVTGTVYDGTTTNVESKYNDGSLTTLSANWSGFFDALSGIASYSYSIGTTAGATDVLSWTGNATTSVTNNSLALHTSQVYFFNVRAIDQVGNVSAVASSPGLVVAPTLTFSMTTNAIAFDPPTSLNSYTSVKTNDITVNSNAQFGYKVTQRATQVLTGPQTIPMYSGTWASPTVWSGTGWGYTSSDPSVAGSNRFSTGNNYAGLTTSAGGDIVADSSNSAPTGDTYTLTYKLSTPSTQAAGIYTSLIVLSCVATF